jgi:hypothetical protein
MRFMEKKLYNLVADTKALRMSNVKQWMVYEWRRTALLNQVLLKDVQIFGTYHSTEERLMVCFYESHK